MAQAAKRKYRVQVLAKNILTAVYELREAISAVRHPFMRYSQEPDLPKEKLKELSAREKKWQALVQVYQKWWEPVPAAKAKLDANLLEAEAVWGRDSVGKITPLNGLIGELLWAIQDYLEKQNPNFDYESPEREEIKKRQDIMYSRGDAEKDEYRKRLEAAISDIEAELKPHIVQYHR
jgi:hypothetical protein